ncbi:rhodanese-related sulfurtransferase [Synechococcus sp. RSCCF101]|uniref:oxygen-dependent tRNA uridine(34) hydroxylase TrhO n=1 Tax=Synechococcus sp. RSCCF101 TaxID=2511069 RepID=UPI001CD9CC00|nr:rhodanese-related sulfurtransferase [Synechococcus sp. RSCCF101]
MPPVLIAAFYRFAPLGTGRRAWKQELEELGRRQGLKGTLLLAAEGINGTVAGPESGVGELLKTLQARPGFADLPVRFSRADTAPFHRFKVRLKREIVSMGAPALDPRIRVGHYVSPHDWDALIADPGTLVIDTRNAYEVAVGSFEGAVDPHTASFHDFPSWVERELRPLVARQRPQRLALFCTGGIRCEKATSHLVEQGFSEVHHLQGGILRYLEERPEQGSRWRGECFVFDQRVALNHQLEPGEHSLCHACRMPLSPADRQLQSYVEGLSCRHCIDQRSAADRRRFGERQQQMVLAAARGEPHIGRVFPQEG